LPPISGGQRIYWKVTWMCPLVPMIEACWRWTKTWALVESYRHWFYSHFAHHKYQLDWPGFEPRSPQEEGGDWLTHGKTSKFIHKFNSYHTQNKHYRNFKDQSGCTPVEIAAVCSEHTHISTRHSRSCIYLPLGFMP